MTIKDGIECALKQGHISRMELLPYLRVSSKSALYNKFALENWTGNELAIIAQLTGGELVIHYPDGFQIPISVAIPEPKKPASTKSKQTPEPAQQAPEQTPPDDVDALLDFMDAGK